MPEQPPILTPDEAQVFSAVFFLQQQGPCFYGTLVARLHLPVTTIRHCLETLTGRGLLACTGYPPVYVIKFVEVRIYDYLAALIYPILDENRLLRSQRDTDLQYQSDQLNIVRNFRDALTRIAQHESEEGQIASTALHSAEAGSKSS
jgi:hypothetical protein